jgi:hypothetical protein
VARTARRARSATRAAASARSTIAIATNAPAAPASPGFGAPRDASPPRRWPRWRTQLLRVEGVDPLAMPRYLELNLRVPLDGGNDIRHAAGTAVEQILQRVREVREHENALCAQAPSTATSRTPRTPKAAARPSRVRCSMATRRRASPQFTDFVTMAIERKDPNIDRLLAGEELVLTRVTMGRVLRTQQLAEFGGNSPVFKILGQVDAGLFKVLGAAGKCAFSFQLLRGATLEGRMRLRLHAVGASIRWSSPTRR